MLVVTSHHVVLPDEEIARPATLEIDIGSGKILNIYPSKGDRSKYPSLNDEDWIDAGDLYILPGLVE